MIHTITFEIDVDTDSRGEAVFRAHCAMGSLSDYDPRVVSYRLAVHEAPALDAPQLSKLSTKGGTQ